MWLDLTQSFKSNAKHFTNQNFHMNVEVICEINQQVAENCPSDAPWIRFWVLCLDGQYFYTKQNHNGRVQSDLFCILFSRCNRIAWIYQIPPMSETSKLTFPMDARRSLVLNSARRLLSWRTISAKLCNISVSLLSSTFSQDFYRVFQYKQVIIYKKITLHWIWTRNSTQSPITFYALTLDWNDANIRTDSMPKCVDLDCEGKVLCVSQCKCECEWVCVYRDTTAWLRYKHMLWHLFSPHCYFACGSAHIIHNQWTARISTATEINGIVYVIRACDIVL